MRKIYETPVDSVQTALSFFREGSSTEVSYKRILHVSLDLAVNGTKYLISIHIANPKIIREEASLCLVVCSTPTLGTKYI